MTAPGVTNWRLRNVPDELHIHGSLERREKRTACENLLPKMVLSELKMLLSTAFGAQTSRLQDTQAAGSLEDGDKPSETEAEQARFRWRRVHRFANHSRLLYIKWRRSDTAEQGLRMSDWRLSSGRKMHT